MSSASLGLARVMPKTKKEEAAKVGEKGGRRKRKLPDPVETPEKRVKEEDAAGEVTPGEKTEQKHGEGVEEKDAKNGQKDAKNGKTEVSEEAAQCN